MATDGIESIFNEMAEQSVAQTGGVIPPTQAPSVRRGNEVFASNAREDYTRKDLGFEIPVDAVPLPSAGKVYPEGHPLYQAAHIEYRAMTAREEDILMSQALIKKGTVITELIKSCLTNKTINVSSLLSGDRNALMVGIRISGYGRDYEPTFVCPECSHKNEMKIDLADLAIKSLEVDPAVPGQNIFAFYLPASKKKVEFKFLTGEEEEKIMKELESRKKRGQTNSNLITSRLMAQIISVEGNSEQGVISKFISYMPAKDSLSLRSYIDKNEPGVNMEVEFQCTNCDYFDMIQLPMGPSFFWPRARA